MILRKNTGWMDGFYGLPAGKVEYGETYLEAAIREAKEEAGVDIKPEDLRFVHVVHRHGEKDDLFMDWVDVYFEATKWAGEPYNAEEDKSEKLEWVSVEENKEKIVAPQADALKRINCGEHFSVYWSDN